MLVRDPARIARCLTEKLFIYGLGRGLGFSDRAMIDKIVALTQDRDYGFRSLIHEFVASEAFSRP